jgi:cytochrome P450
MDRHLRIIHGRSQFAHWTNRHSQPGEEMKGHLTEATPLETIMKGGDAVHGNFQEHVDRLRQRGALQSYGSNLWCVGYQACSDLLGSDNVGEAGSYTDFFGGAIGSLRQLQHNWLETRGGPEHARKRSVARKPFSSTMIVKHLLEIADQLIDSKLDDLGRMFEGDLRNALTRPLGAELLVNWSGVPADTAAAFVDTVNLVGATVGPVLSDDDERVVKAAAALDDLIPRLLDLLRSDLPNGLFAALREANDTAHDPLSDLELISHVLNFAFDSELIEPQLTTSLAEYLTEAADSAHHLSGAHADRLIWELLRLGTGSPLILRRATRDFEYEKVAVGKDQWIVFYLAAALRDPEAFENPPTADISRGPTSLVFGAGDHTCLGGRLAFQVTKKTLVGIAERYQMELMGDLGWMTGTYRGVDHLPIRLVAR